VRDHHAMAYDAARAVVVVFGGAPGTASFPNDTWTWDGTAWRMADSTTGPGGLVHHAMAYDKRRRRVVMYGGFVPDRPRSSDVWEWDGSRWHRITADSAGPGIRTHHRMAYDEDRGVVVLYGGFGAPVGETWTWDGRRWTRASTDGPSRNMQAMAWDAARRRIVMFGGGREGEHGALNDLWEWDGTRWEQRH